MIGAAIILSAGVAFAMWWLGPRPPHKTPYEKWPKGEARNWPDTKKRLK